MSLPGYIASKTTPPHAPDTGAEHYRDVADYDPVLRSHCRLPDETAPRKNEDENEL